MDKPRHVLVTGPPGSGKTTEGRRLAKLRGLPFISGDDVQARGHKFPGSSDLRRALRKLDKPHVVEGVQILGFRPSAVRGHELILMEETPDILTKRLMRRGFTDSAGTKHKGIRSRKAAEKITQEFAGYLSAFKKRMGRGQHVKTAAARPQHATRFEHGSQIQSGGKLATAVREPYTPTAHKVASHVIVTGHSGSGKTTHAMRIGKERGLPVLHVDMHPKYQAAWAAFEEERKNTGAITSETYQKAVRKAASELLRTRKPHVIEGTAFLTNQDLLGKHEVILVTAPKRKILAKRLARTKERAALRGRPWTPEIRQEQKARGAAIFDAYKKQVDELRRNKATNVYRNAYTAPTIGTDPWIQYKERTKKASPWFITGTTKTAAIVPGYPLYDHQKIALKQLLDNDGVLVLAHGTGTGKTFTAIAGFELLKHQGKATRALVVVPTSLRENFSSGGVKRFTNGSVQIVGNKQEAAIMPGYLYPTDIKGDKDYTVVGYELFRSDPVGIMTRAGADTLILDEYHKARDPQSQTFKAAMQARQQARNFIGATASVVNNDPNEVAPLVALAKAGKFYTAKQFDRLFKQKAGVSRGLFGGKKNMYTLRNMDKLKRELGPAVSYLDTEDLPANVMPKKKVDVVDVQMSPEQQDLYQFAFNKIDKATAERIKNNLPPSSPKEAMNIFTTILLARKASNSIGTLNGVITLAESAERTPKVKRLLDDADNHLATTPDAQIVMYSNLVAGGVDVLSAGLKARGISHGIFIGKGRELDGEKITTESRDSAVTDFQKGKIKVIVLSGAGAEGLDLKDATMFQALDGHFNPERILQAEARARRLKGQMHREADKREVVVKRYRSILPKPGFFASIFGGEKKEFSTDEWIYGTAERKHTLNKMLRHAVRSVSLAKSGGTAPEITLPIVSAQTTTKVLQPQKQQPPSFLRSLTQTAPKASTFASTPVAVKHTNQQPTLLKVPKQHKYLRKWRNPKTNEWEYEYAKTSF